MSGPSTAGPSSDPLTSPVEALYWTQYGTWYPLFRKHAPKSTIIDIDSTQPELLTWLESDTFVLPEGSGPSTYPSADQDSEDDDDDAEEPEQAIKLEALDRAIRAVVEKYDGEPVFPKLNWSAPLDAGFMLPGNSLQCLHPEDVYLLLKSSEFVGRDMEQIAQTNCDTTSPSHSSHHVQSDEDPAQLKITTTHTKEGQRRIRPQLVLKKWFQLSRSYEFRCFVRAGALIAITQRDVTFYDHLQSAHLQSRIRTSIYEFWEDVLANKGDFPIQDYIFDVYLTKDLGRVWLIDVNAWLPRTDPLLFSFEELEELHLREKACRVEESDREEKTVRVYLGSKAADAPGEQTDEGEEEESEGWGESDVEVRVLSDRRMQSSGGTGATYSSNMVPKDLVEFARTSSESNTTQPGQGMSVDQIVSRFNAQVDLEESSR